MLLDLGCGCNKAPGYEGLDKVPFPGVTYVHDLEVIPWPFADSSVDGLRARHVLEHIHNLIDVMNEAHRILKPGAKFHIYVPMVVDSVGQIHPEAFQDPTHVRFFVPETWSYFTGRRETQMYGILPWQRLHYEEADWEAYVILEKVCTS
ncbi:MAG: class I SAM-dependent methyltransferase [Chloroflexi bacterium]|nr:MAG: class I SAM-dependent methyltransferase [Chloroflexota bacterium]